MNKMTAAKTIKQAILKKGPDSLWSLADFSDHSPQAVVQAFSRLAKSGLLVRIRKGVYHYPKQTALGATKPDAARILKKAPKSPDKAVLGGVSAFYNMGLTTQVPATTVVLSPAYSKGVQLGKQRVRVRHRNPRLFQGASNREIWVLEALRSITRIPNTTPADAIARVKDYIRGNKLSLKHLLALSRHHSPRARALLGAVATDLGYKGHDLAALKDSLNPLTHYRVNPGASLRHAKDWNIL